MKTLLFLGLIALALSAKPTLTGSYFALSLQYGVVPITKEQTVDLFENSDYLASATFIDDRSNTGWTHYMVNTSSKYTDVEQAGAAGYLEGYLGYQFVYQNYIDQSATNMSLSQEVIDFVTAQSNWVNQQVGLNPNSSFWQLVNITLSQYYGIYEGYTEAVLLKGTQDMLISSDDFYWVSYGSDLNDVISKFNKTNFRTDKPQQGHCSFLLKLVEDDLFVSHDTWTTYTQMFKVFKTLNFSFSNPAVKNQMMQFTSTPGCIPSIDDFYMLSDNRFVSETTILNFSPHVYDFIHWESVPYWIRINVANLAYDTQETWAEYYFTNRAGTYNNQWLVIDFNQYFSAKNNLSQASNIIWIIEEFYGMTSATDVTQSMLIPDGYVASYNVPFNPLVQIYSTNPPGNTYDTAPRFFLFQKYAPGIQNIEDFKYVMRINNYSDFHNWSEAIASRFDLLPTGASPFGAIDSKVTAASLISDMQAWLIIGPTTQNVTPFTWDDWPAYANMTLGMPRKYDFNWTFFDPNNVSDDSDVELVY